MFGWTEGKFKKSLSNMYKRGKKGPLWYIRDKNKKKTKN